MNNGPTTNNGDMILLEELGGFTLNNNNVLTNNGFILIESGETLNNNAGGTINNNDGAEIDNEGELNNFGIIKNDGDIFTSNELNNKPGGVINNLGGGTGLIENDDEIVNEGTINNSGVITNFDIIENEEGGVINNQEDGFIEQFSEDSEGDINNFGTINNDGVIFMDDDSDIESFGSGVVNNNGVINNRGGLNTYDNAVLNNNAGGVITTSGTVCPDEICILGVTASSDDDITMENAGTINNAGIINIGPPDPGPSTDTPNLSTCDSGVTNNSGTINVKSGAILENAGTETFECASGDGVINNSESGTINVESGGEISNMGEGIINNSGDINNEAGESITNDATVNNKVTGIIDTRFGNIANLANGVIINEGLIKNNADTSIDNEGDIINQCTGVIEPDAPFDIDDGKTWNRSCNGILYSISENPSILEVDPTNGDEISSFTVSEAFSGLGLATNPLTGQLWGLAIFDDADDDKTFVFTSEPADETTAFVAFTDNGSLTDIAFDSSGTLFGITEEVDVAESTSSTLVEIDTSDGTTTVVCDLVKDDGFPDGVPNTIGFNFADGFLYRAVNEVNEGAFQKITDTSGEECVTLDQNTGGSGFGGNYQALTWGDDEEKFFTADNDATSLFDMIFAGLGWLVTDLGGFTQPNGEPGHTSHGLAFVPFEEPTVVFAKTSGNAGHEPPTIGKSLDGVRQVVECGISIDGECRTVTSGYHEEMELLQMLTSPHTISNTINCGKGVQYCNYIAVGFMGLTDDFNNPVMTVSASKDFAGDWTLGWYDPDDFISDPGDAVAGDIVFVPQIIDNYLLGTSFTIDFKNKDTGQLKLGIQVRDSYNGVRNFYFNEGVEFIDSDAYPNVDAVYDEPIEVDPLCFGQNVPDRNSCAFAKIKDWATANAEDALRQMMNGQYQYEQ